MEGTIFEEFENSPDMNSMNSPKETNPLGFRFDRQPTHNRLGYLIWPL